jgi:hypothetical protein
MKLSPAVEKWQKSWAFGETPKYFYVNSKNLFLIYFCPLQNFLPRLPFAPIRAERTQYREQERKRDVKNNHKELFRA